MILINGKKFNIFKTLLSAGSPVDRIECLIDHHSVVIISDPVEFFERGNPPSITDRPERPNGF